MPRWLSVGAPADSNGGGLRAKYPPVAMDMDTTHLVLARLAKDKLRRWTLTSYDVSELPPDLLDSEVFRVRIKSVERFKALVAGSMQKEGVKTEKVSLVLPDHLARVSLLPFEELPRSRRDVVEMVRWKMKKAVPFKVEEATVDYQVMPGPEKGYTVLAVLMPQSILQEQEAVFAQQGIHPGLVDISSFSLAHLYRSVIDKEVPAGADFMLLNVTGAFFTVMVFREGRLIFYRCKTFAFGGNDDPESGYRLVHRELQASLLYYQEKLMGRELARVYMRLVGMDADRVAGQFGGAPIAARPELIDVQRVVNVTGRIASMGPDRAADLLQRLAPAVGAALGREA
jgi:type IV pilus assembly protein PilM